MLKVFRLILLITCGLFLADGMAAATEEARAEEMTLRRVEAKGAVIVLRSILGLRQLEVVARAILRHASSRDVMIALRSLGISRMATVGEPSTVIVRDSAEQVALAMDRIRLLDRDVP